MSEVMLPWPEPGRPKKDRAAPHYEIQRVNDDGSTGPIEVLPITKPPWAAEMGRRGLLGAGIASSVAAALLLSACNDGKAKPPSTPSPSPSEGTPSPSPTEESTSPSYPSGGYGSGGYGSGGYPSSGYGFGGYGSGGYGSGGYGGTICTCNKVCTCIPVCQAHRLLDPDPTVRRMAEIVVLAMGLRELPYLHWAASEAPTPLRARIKDLIGQLRRGRRLGTDDLADAEYAPYLTSGDPVIALMAAQVLSLRALSRGTRLNGTLAERVVEALTAGRALHLERAPNWSH